MNKHLKKPAKKPRQTSDLESLELTVPMSTQDHMMLAAVCYS